MSDEQQNETDKDQPLSGEPKDWAISEMVKRAIVSGIGAIFLTEEGIRSYIGELKLPKEAAQYILSQVGRTKEEVLRVITDEIRSFLEETQLDDVLRKVLTNISLEISTKVRFVDESGTLQPKTTAKLKVSSERKKKKASQAQEP